MKRTVIAAATAVSLMFTGMAFGAEGTQPSKGTAPTFEQMKAGHLKMLDDRINSLQKERTCAQAAKTPDDIQACRKKHREEMKGHGHRIKGERGMGSMGSTGSTQTK